MRAGRVAEVFIGMVGFWLAFLLPFAFVAVVKVKKIKLPPLVVYSVFGIVWFVATLILLPMDPIGRKLSRPDLVTAALAVGLFGFICLPAQNGLARVWDKAEIAIKKRSSLQASRQNESRGSEAANQTEPKPTGDGGPSS